MALDLLNPSEPLRPPCPASPLHPIPMCCSANDPHNHPPRPLSRPLPLQRAPHQPLLVPDAATDPGRVHGIRGQHTEQVPAIHVAVRGHCEPRSVHIRVREADSAEVPSQESCQREYSGRGEEREGGCCGC
jgi:hypothetical protein